MATPMTPMTPEDLRAIMARHNLRQVDLAEKLGMSQASISKMLAGKRPIVERTARLARAIRSR